MTTATSPVTVKIGNHAFVALPLELATFDHKGAIYVVFERESADVFKVLDVGESSIDGTASLDTPARREAWQRQARTGDIWVGSYGVPTEKLFSMAKNPDEERAMIVQQLRQEYLAS